MLRSILRQLICSPVPSKVLELWKHHHRYGTEPSYSELLDAIKDLVAVYKYVFLVFDALDEYPENKSPGRSTLLETIEQLRTMYQKHTRLIVTSRREPGIREKLQHVAYRSINVDQALEGDIEKFVDNALSHESIKRWGAELMALVRVPFLRVKQFLSSYHLNLPAMAKGKSLGNSDGQISRSSACMVAQRPTDSERHSILSLRH